MSGTRPSPNPSPSPVATAGAPATASPAASAPAPAASPSSSSSAAPLLGASRLPLSTLREHARRELGALLDAQPGVGKGGTGTGTGADRDNPLPSPSPAATGLRKALVLDRALSGPLGVVCEVSLLKRHGVDQIYHLEVGSGDSSDPARSRPLNTDCQHIIYLITPQRQQIQTIAQHMLHWKGNTNTSTPTNTNNKQTMKPTTTTRYVHIYFVPRRTVVAERALIECGIYGDVVTGEYPLELIPFDDDLISMEHINTFKQHTVDGDPSSLFSIARSLMKLQSLCGLIPNIKGKGPAARRVYDLMVRMRRESLVSSSSSSSSASSSSSSCDIDTLILIDRQVDMVTPTLTQLTYEGLLDEVFGIKHSFIEVDPEVLGVPADSTASGTPARSRKLALNSNDSLFSEIRDLSFRVLGPLLHKKAEFIKDTYSQRHQAVTVNDMHSFMQKFKTAHVEHTYLQTHINLAERISVFTKSKMFDRQLEIERMMLDGQDPTPIEDYIEDRISKREPITKVIRLLVLLSLTAGIRAKKYDFLKREIIQTYGYQHILTLANLERVGLLSDVSRKSAWQTIRRALRLSVPDVDLSNPQDMAYTYQGYAPISCRIIELAQQKGGWKRAEEALNLLPGRSFEVSQEASIDPSAPKLTSAPTPTAASASSSQGPGQAPPPTPKPNQITNESSSSSSYSKDKKPLTLVYFIGGVCHSEIASLRHLSGSASHGRDYVVATSALVSGNTLLETLQEQIPNQLQYQTLSQS